MTLEQDPLVDPACAPVWEHPPARLRIGRGEVHVWLASLRLPEPTLESLERALAPEERARASRFRLDAVRRDYIAARGILRGILGRYRHQDPATLRLGHTPRGKPYLLDEPGAEPLEFNLSHSGDAALYAVALGRSVGVDLEQVRGPIEYERIALRCFTPSEIALLGSVAPEARATVFFACWTRMEARVKARGEGLASVWRRGAPAGHDDASESPGWVVRDLPVPAGYAAAIAFEGVGAVLRCWRWPEPPAP